MDSVSALALRANRNPYAVFDEFRCLARCARLQDVGVPCKQDAETVASAKHASVAPASLTYMEVGVLS